METRKDEARIEVRDSNEAHPMETELEEIQEEESGDYDSSDSN